MTPEVLDLFDITPAQIAPRSRLIALEPIGIGTSMVEALTSFFSRTAREHVVSPAMLFNRIVLPLTKIELTKYSSNFYKQDAGTMNGYLKYARETVRALEILTCRKNLDRITMLPWAQVLNRTGAKVLRRHPAFCPACLTQWHQNGTEIYYPLAWHLMAITACPEHAAMLVEQCPHCHRRQSILGRHGVLGHCTHCGLWLGMSPSRVSAAASDPTESTPGNDFHQDAVLEMLATASQHTFNVTRHMFVDRLQAHIDVTCNGMTRTFEKRFGFQNNVISNWLDRYQPRLDMFLALCHRLDRTPNAFLFEPIPVDLGSTLPTVSTPLTVMRKRQTDTELKNIEHGLASFLESDVPITQLEAAARLGVSHRVLTYHFPDLAAQISAKRKAHVHAQAVAKLERKLQTTARVTTELMSNPRSISRRKVGKELEKEGVTMADPEVRKVAKEIMKRPNVYGASANQNKSEKP